MPSPPPSPRFVGSAAAAALALAAAPSHAVAQDGGGASYFDMFFTSGDRIGQAIIILLVLLSALSVALAVQFALRYRRSALLPPASERELRAMIAGRRYREAIQFAREDRSYLGRVASAALNEASHGYVAMERAVEEAGDAETTRMLRPLEYLNVLGQVAPMIGLFGTVYGMIVAFQKLVEAGGTPDPAQLAAGISTALVTTLWGLVVAIPALAAYAVIRNRLDALTRDGLLVVESIIAPFKPSRRASSGGGSSGDAGAPRPRATPKPE